METDDLELDTLGDRKTALFVIISDTDDTFNFIVAMMYTQLFNLLCDKADDFYGGRLPVHVRCLLDEVANIGQIPKLEKLIATIRSREISACLILQAQSQLKAIYKDNADTITGNCDTTPEPEDYTGEDGLLYCGKCRKPKEAYFAPDKAAIFGRDRHPAECDCQKTAREEREAAEKRRRHLDTVEELKRRGFTDPTMRDWTFENDNGRNPQTGLARRYVEHWEDMRTDNIGCLFWGGVGTGKSYLAGCIANALMEKEIPVHMTNFALILNDLAASFEGRNEYISRLCRYPLLILDDFGMERGTEYGLEQVFNVIDSRYRSGKPLIVTTNLTLDDLHNPEDTAHSRIYDRLLSMCVPVRFTGDNFRQETAKRKMESMKKLITD